MLMWASFHYSQKSFVEREREEAEEEKKEIAV